MVLGLSHVNSYESLQFNVYVTGQNKIQVKIKFLCLLTLLIHLGLEDKGNQVKIIFT